MRGRARSDARRAVVAALAALGAVGCGPSFVAVRPTEPLAADAGRVHADVTRLWLTDDVRERGLADDVDLVVELRVRNGGARPRTISPGSFSCLMALDPRRPGDTRALLPGGGGEGAFAGEPPDEGSMLAPVTIPPGEARDLWAIFHGYRFDGSDRPRRVTLTIPLDDGALPLDLADPSRGALQWEAPAERNGFAIGLRNVSLLGGPLRATAPGTEISFVWRRGPVLWDVGLVSSVFVETQGPLRSVTSSFGGTGLQAHLTVPLLSWGTPAEARELGLYGGGSTALLVEMLTPAAAMSNQMKMLGPEAYGFFTVEAGVELDLGALRFADTPFPLSPARRALPRWSLRLAYVQGWAGGATGGGLLTNARFTF